MGGMVVVIQSFRGEGPCSIPCSSQHMTQYFHSSTISLASIASSVLSM